MKITAYDLMRSGRSPGSGSVRPSPQNMRHPSASSSALRLWAQFATEIELATLSDAVVEKAKLCIVDALSASLTLGITPEGVQAADLAKAKGCSPVATVFGSELRTSAADAAFVNGTSAAGTARSDTYALTSSHPGSVVVPAVLALAEAENRGGGDVLCAVVAGYEAMCRLGETLITPSIAVIHRPTGVTGPTGAGVAAARVLGLDAQQTCNAAALATHGASGLNAWALAGTSEMQFHSGSAARCGVEAAQLARAGMRAASTTLDGTAGLLQAFGGSERAERLTAGLGEHLRILEVVHKPAPACIYVQTPCQVAQRIVESGLPGPGAIASIHVAVCDAAMRYPGCNDAGPGFTPRRSKMSIQYCVASVLAFGGLNDTNWADPTNATVERLAAITHLEEDPALTAAYPRVGCRIRVSCADGRTMECAQSDFVSMTTQAVMQRFRTAALPRLGAVRTEQVLVLIAKMDQSTSLAPLFAALAA